MLKTDIDFRGCSKENKCKEKIITIGCLLQPGKDQINLSTNSEWDISKREEKWTSELEVFLLQVKRKLLG